MTAARDSSSFNVLRFLSVRAFMSRAAVAGVVAAVVAVVVVVVVVVAAAAAGAVAVVAVVVVASVGVAVAVAVVAVAVVVVVVVVVVGVVLGVVAVVIVVVVVVVVVRDAPQPLAVDAVVPGRRRAARDSSDKAAQTVSTTAAAKNSGTGGITWNGGARVSSAATASAVADAGGRCSEYNGSQTTIFSSALFLPAASISPCID